MPRSLMLALLVACATAPLVVHAGRQSTSPFTGPVTPLASPAPPGSSGPQLAVDGKGRVLLSWLETRVSGGHRFRMASLAATGWSPAVTIAEGDRFVANWADVPSIFVTRKGQLAAHWLERRGPARAAYDVRVSTSADDGKTWSTPITPHRDGTATEHGFVSFFEAPDKGLGLVWLDGREMAGHGGGHATGGAQMTLRAATVSAAGVAGEEMVVDARVCDCCPTAAATTADSVVVAYRDRSEAEIRDIAVSHFAGGSWSKAAMVHADKWEINGCPVNGPAIAARGKSVAVAWFTSAGGTPQSKLAFSSDGGRSFKEPVRLDSALTLGRMALTMVNADRVLISWIEKTGDETHLIVREASARGSLSAPVKVAGVSSERSSGFPRLALSGRRLIVAWTDARPGSPTQVTLASTTLAR